MLDKMNPGPAETMTPLTLDPAASDDDLQEAITQIAEHLRQAGHVETAHFMGVAALVLRE
ncbi:MAG: hypothetical protein VCD66_16980 [Alphaproteobacteria bacterium]|jgi:hypothetical protein